MLPLVASSDHALMLRYAAIYFLGYLVPSSTGNDFFALMNVPRDLQSRRSDLDIVVSMNLEERLENTCKFFHSNEFGEYDVCPDPVVETSFHTFLQRGILPFLGARAAHPFETDLLHLIAMAISPQPNGDLIPATNTRLSDKNDPAWMKAERLMKNLHAHSLKLHYSHRLMLVEAIANHLVLPEVDSIGRNSPLIYGAVPHLRASLHAFANGARCTEEAHLAHRALVSLAIYAGQDFGVEEEWNFLLTRTIQDYSPCQCAKKTFCPHLSRGKLLESFILRYNGSRLYADEGFTDRVLLSLGEAIRQVVTSWTKEKEKAPKWQSSECLLGHLLLAARSIFYFLLNTGADKDAVEKRKKVCKGLVDSAIQLVHHPSHKIREKASCLLSLTIAYSPKQDAIKLMPKLFASLKLSLEEAFNGEESFSLVQTQCIRSVVVAASRQSKGFATSLFDFLAATRASLSASESDHDRKSEAIARLVSAVSISQPFVILRKCTEVSDMIQSDRSLPGKCQLVSAILAARQAVYFDAEFQNSAHKAISELNLAKKCPSEAYKLAGLALITGNHACAREWYSELLSSAQSEESFLWLQCLANISEGEETLLKHGAKGLPPATSKLATSLSSIDNLDEKNYSFQVQAEILRLRIDFLELCAAARLISQEIRLTGEFPKTTTRVGLHLRNVLRCWKALAARYYSLYRRKGLFLCQQSRSSLRTVHAMCRKIGILGNRLIGEMASGNKTQDAESTLWPAGDSMHPSTQLLGKLEQVVEEKIDRSVEPNVRGTFYSEVIDGVLLTPFPYARGFLTVKTIPRAHFRIFFDAEDDESLTPSLDDLKEAGVPSNTEYGTVYPGMPYSIVASGQVPAKLQAMAKVEFSQMLLWYSVSCVAAAADDDEQESETATRHAADVKFGEAAPTSFSLPPSGKFVVPLELQAIRDEGLYRVDIKLGCRDVRCGEWELTTQRSGVVVVRVTRSRS